MTNNLMPNVYERCADQNLWLENLANSKGLNHSVTSLQIIQDFTGIFCNYLMPMASVEAKGKNINNIYIAELGEAAKNAYDKIGFISIFDKTCLVPMLEFKMGEARVTLGKAHYIFTDTTLPLTIKQEHSFVYSHPNTDQIALDSGYKMLKTTYSDMCQALMKDGAVHTFYSLDMYANHLNPYSLLVYREVNRGGFDVSEINKPEQVMHNIFNNILNAVQNASPDIGVGYSDAYTALDVILKYNHEILTQPENKMFSLVLLQALPSNTQQTDIFFDLAFTQKIFDHFDHSDWATFIATIFSKNLIGYKGDRDYYTYGKAMEHILNLNLDKEAITEAFKLLDYKNFTLTSFNALKGFLSSYKETLGEEEYSSLYQDMTLNRNAVLYSKFFTGIVQCEDSFADCDKLGDDLVGFYKSSPKELKQILDIVTYSYHGGSYGIKILYEPNGEYRGVYDWKNVIVNDYKHISPEFHATLAHEMAHRAMDMIWHNNADPYGKSNLDKAKEVYGGAQAGVDLGKFYSDKNEIKDLYHSYMHKNDDLMSQIRCFVNYKSCNEVSNMQESYPPKFYDREYVVRYYQMLVLDKGDANGFFTGMKKYHYDAILPEAIKAGLLSADEMWVYGETDNYLNPFILPSPLF